MGEFFGTDGFRGEAGKTLTAEKAFSLGCFLGEYLSAFRPSPRVVIGKDPRRSSYMLEYALAAGLTSCGANVYLLHVTTTPSVGYVVLSEGFDFGVMISASHNAYTDNGIKFLDARGEKPDEEVIRRAEEYLKEGRAPAFVSGEKIGRTVDYVEGRNRYAGYLISLARYSLRGLKIGLDCANGSAFFLAGSVFSALGAQVYTIHAQPSGVNINERCGSTRPEVLAQFVQSHRLDIGFAFDGDADRCICVDASGKVVDGDGILYLCALYMQERGELEGNLVVGTVMTGEGLVRALQKKGIACERAFVGDKYVQRRMRETGACLGGEPSGHVIFRKHSSTGDGIVTAIKVLEVILERKKPLSELLADYTPLPSVLVNVPVQNKVAVNAPAVVRAAARWNEEGKVRVLVRASGTENKVRILAEGESLSDCRVAAALIEEAVRAEDK